MLLYSMEGVQMLGYSVKGVCNAGVQRGGVYSYGGELNEKGSSRG